MTRFLFRLLAMVALSVAVIMAVLDATRSIAGSQIVLTPLGTSWHAASPETLAAAQELVQTYLLPELWDPVAIAILSLPGFVVFAGLAFLFQLVGRRPRPRAGRFAVGR